MNKSELKKHLQELKIRPDAYFMDGGSPPSDIYVLEEIYGRWFVYYSERGNRNDENEFASEDAACQYFLECIKSDPLTRQN